jgi:hypothetical protein
MSYGHNMLFLLHSIATCFGGKYQVFVRCSSHRSNRSAIGNHAISVHTHASGSAASDSVENKQRPGYAHSFRTCAPASGFSGQHG